MGGLNSLAGGLGELVLNIGARDLGDGVAVLHLNRDILHLGVVHTVLGGDLTACVLHSGGDGVGHRVGSRQSNGGRGNQRGSSNEGGGDSVGQSMGGEELGISLSISLTLVDGMSNGCDRSITDGVNNLLADLLILNLLSSHGLCGAHVLSTGGADLGDQDHVLGDTVGGGGESERGSQRSQAKELSISISISRGGCSREGSQTGQDDDLGNQVQ
jgi:hypothetical protein